MDIKERYGAYPDLGRLSDEQRKFLLHPNITDYVDGTGQRTVIVEEVRVIDETLEILLKDCYTYRPQERKKTPFEYSRERLEAYNEVSEKIRQLSNDRYLVILHDNSEIEVQFETK